MIFPEPQILFAPHQDTDFNGAPEDENEKNDIPKHNTLENEADSERPLVAMQVQRFRRKVKETMRITKKTMRATSNAQIEDDISAGNFDRIGELTRLSEEAASKLANSGQHCLMLVSLKSIRAAAAEKLKNYTGLIFLDNVKEIDTATIKALAETPCMLVSLNGLTELSPEQAMILGKAKCKALSFNGIGRLDRQVAHGLSFFMGCLYLEGVSTLDEEAVKSLLYPRKIHVKAACEYSDIFKKKLNSVQEERMYVEDLERLIPPTAKTIRNYIQVILTGGREISIDMLKDFFPDLKEQLDKLSLKTIPFSGFERSYPKKAAKIHDYETMSYDTDVIYMNNLRDVPDEALPIMRKFIHRLKVSKSLEHLLTLDNMSTSDIKEYVDKWKTNFGAWKEILRGNIQVAPVVTTLSPEVAEALVGQSQRLKHQQLALSRLDQMDEETAEALIKFNGDEIYLEKLEDVGIEVLEVLSQFSGKVVLPTTPDFRHDIEIWREILADNFDRVGELHGLTPEVAKHLVSQNFPILDLPIETLCAETAEILTKFSGNALKLNRLVDASPERVVQLASAKAQTLQLDGLTNIDRIMVDAFIDSPRRLLSLRGIHEMSENAYLLMRDFQGILRLNNELPSPVEKNDRLKQLRNRMRRKK